MQTVLILSIIYLAGVIYTYFACTPADAPRDPIDYFVIPVVSFLWPLAWSFVIGMELLGFLKRKIRIRRRRKFDVKNKQ